MGQEVLIVTCILTFGIFDLSVFLFEECCSLMTVLNVDCFCLCSAAAKVVGANLAPSVVTLSFIFLW